MTDRGAIHSAAPSAAIEATIASPPSRAAWRASLAAKLAAALIGLVVLVLVVNGAVNTWLSYNQARSAALDVQQEKARSAAVRVGEFLAEIETQLGWSTGAEWRRAPPDQQRYDFVRLLRQVPAITELSYLDGQGKEQLEVSRLEPDSIASGKDFSNDPRFVQAVADKIWFGPVEFRRGSEPYMTIALAHVGREPGVTVADVNLKLIWDVISAIRVGDKGYAFVVDGKGRLIAHPDLSLVLRDTDFSKLPQVEAALQDQAPVEPGASAITAPRVGLAKIATGFDGASVLTAYAVAPRTHWIVFVQQPLAEALASVYKSLYQTLALLGLGLLLALVIGGLLARRMVVPIRRLQQGAERLGAGDLSQRLDIRTGDEIETLADRFNQMAGRIQESYETLEAKVVARTAELNGALQQQTATADVLQVISGSVADTAPVFEKIVESCERLFSGLVMSVYQIDDAERLTIAAIRGPDPDMIQRVRNAFPAPLAGTGSELAIRERRVVAIADVWNDPETPDSLRSFAKRLGQNFSTVFAPMLWEGRAIGAIQVVRTDMKPFETTELRLLQTFADQAVIAIQNARLFNETREALEQQKASADVLSVIGKSVSDAQPVFEEILGACQRLFGSDEIGIYTIGDDDMVRVAAWRGPRAVEVRNDVTPLAESVTGRIIRERRTHHIPDLLADPDLSPTVRERATRLGSASLLYAPMLWEDGGLGSILVVRSPPRPFSDREQALLQTFADQAVIAIQNARLFDEVQARTRDLEESLAQQTATADVLKVISRSVFDLTAVLQTLIDTAVRLARGSRGTIWIRKGDVLVASAFHQNVPSELRAYLSSAPRRLDGEDYLARAARDKTVVHISDLSTHQDPFTAGVRQRVAFGAGLWVPLIRDGETIGVFGVPREEPIAFTDREIEIVKTFADQAVIAIENVRLFDEVQARTRDLEESLAQQTATADVLKAISRTAFDLDTVLHTLVSTAVRLCGANYGEIFRRHGDVYRHAASTMNLDPAYRQHEQSVEIEPGRGTVVGRVALENRAVSIADAWSDPEYEEKDQARLGNVRAMLGAPLMRGGEPIGAFALGRAAPIPFTERQIELVTTFADQAVIAIENVRLFDEVQARTRDLTEALQQQTATADVLKAISRTAFDLDTVLGTLVSTAVRLCNASGGEIFRRHGDNYRYAASRMDVHPAYREHERSVEIKPGRGTLIGRVALENRAVSIADAWSDPEYEEKDEARLGKIRAMLGVPLMRGGEPIGAFALGRPAPIPFTERQIELVTTFADQAVIAIENVRLFDEVQARTRDLTEALQQQTATAEVLKVISRSAFDLQAVFDTLLSSAVELSGVNAGAICLRDGDVFRYRATSGLNEDFARFLAEYRQVATRTMVAGRVILSGKVEFIVDTREDAEYVAPALGLSEARAVLGVPLLRDEGVEGVLILLRTAPGPFLPRQIELMQTFADQAVIAIENVRLFDEVQARTRDLSEALQMQTATSDVLKVISRSAFDLQTVFNTLVTSAVELGGALTGTICVRDGDVFRYRDTIGAEHTSALAQYLRDHPATPGRSTIAGRVLLSGKVERIPDCLADPEYVVPMGSLATNVRSLLGVPLLRKEGVEGAIVLTREEPGHFTDRQVEIVQTFADQAVIALENVRLFEEVQARTKELAGSLDNLRKAQDRLVQSEKLASLGQLTAGIAHEIKNPLNFINNFSALSRELLGELRETLAVEPFEKARRGEAEDLIGMVASNLDKVVQHGKRADSIVKNMLLHSREGSGERTSVNINAMVEEALNLAYHGARAEKPGFNVTIAKTLDPNAGVADLYGQEMTRVLLNLVANGIYATTKRKQSDGNGSYEPTISASTRDLGDRVEIAIRDNGTGIPEEVKAKMFNPFFTTKPAGEGTGLGLSLSHDIVVKQHGGTIEVATEPGAYTEFTIQLPRAAQGAPARPGAVH